MAYIPRWSQRLREGQSQAQMSPDTVLRYSHGQPTERRRIRGVTNKMRNDTMEVWRGGNPVAREQAEAARVMANRVSQEAAIQERYNAAVRGTAGTGASEDSLGDGTSEYLKKGYSPQYAETYAANDLSAQKQSQWKARQNERRRRMAVEGITQGFEPVKDAANQSKVYEGGSWLNYDSWKARQRRL